MNTDLMPGESVVREFLRAGIFSLKDNVTKVATSQRNSLVAKLLVSPPPPRRHPINELFDLNTEEACLICDFGDYL